MAKEKTDEKQEKQMTNGSIQWKDKEDKEKEEENNNNNDKEEEEDDNNNRCPHFCKMDTYQISYRCLILALLRTSMRCSS